MTAVDTDMTLPRPRFGVGARMSDTLAIFFGHFAVFGGIGIVAGILMQIPTFLVLGADALDPMAPGADGQLIDQNPFLFIVIVLAVPLLVYSVLTAVLVLAAYDARAERRARIGSYVATGLRQILPLIVMSIAAWLLIGIGFALLIVPGLWLLGVLSVFVPVIMVEGNGFGSLGRSSALTKNYRWPIIGLLMLVYIIVYLVTIAATAVVAFLVPGVPILFLLLQGAASGLSMAFASIAVAVTYARLREIKDGVGFTDLADVFA
ncbi:MAG: hypothetical protein CMP81_22160 [Fulvimarina sp.]|nr:hypothetical protein [Fulvimarina sp.]